MTENQDDNQDFCIKCERDIWFNEFTNKWESDDLDFAAVCMPDGVIREKLHSPRRTTHVPTKVEPQTVNSGHNIAAWGGWGWVVRPPSSSAVPNRRQETTPDISTEGSGTGNTDPVERD